MPDEALQRRITELEQELDQSNQQIDTLGKLLERKLNELYALYHIARTIGLLHDAEELLRQVTAIIKKSIPFDRLSLYLLDDSGSSLNLAFFSGLDVRGKVTLAVGEGVPGRIIETGEHSHIHDLALFYETFNDFIHFPGEEKRDGSYIGIALKAHNTTVGAVGIDGTAKYGLTVDDMDFMAVLSHQIAAGIEKARLFDKIQQLSQRDGLTGLYNHRVFMERLQQEVARRSRTGKPLSLVMLDIDHFKLINDTYGHQEGDKVLKELTEVIKGQCRHTTLDTCGRYGGEEFGVIMPEIEFHNVYKMAERLRAVVASHPFSIKRSHPEAVVTISLGIAGMEGKEDLTAEDLLKKADDAMYQSKRNGRNRVSYAPAGNR